MENYIEIGYEGFGRNVSPVMVKTTSVIEDKSLVFPRIKDIFKVFERDINPKKRDKILEKIIDNTFLLNGNDLETQRLLNYRGGVYSGLNGKIYLDFNKIKTPSLVEHETIHFLGNIRCWGLNYPKRIINHHSIAANIVITLLDKEDYLGRHKLGEASIKEFKKLKWYKLLPIEFQEGIKDFSNTCFKIGNYARESGEGYNLLYKLSK